MEQNKTNYACLWCRTFNIPHNNNQWRKWNTVHLSQKTKGNWGTLKYWNIHQILVCVQCRHTSNTDIIVLERWLGDQVDRMIQSLWSMRIEMLICTFANDVWTHGAIHWLALRLWSIHFTSSSCGKLHSVHLEECQGIGSSLHIRIICIFWNVCLQLPNLTIPRENNFLSKTQKSWMFTHCWAVFISFWYNSQPLYLVSIWLQFWFLF